MFSRRSDASKIALVHLARQLERWGFEMIDCQMSTRHLATLGAREIRRREFLERVRPLTALADIPAPWKLDADLSATF
jgi:leucyl/phenylalanyl-tRNA--protein transferase